MSHSVHCVQFGRLSNNVYFVSHLDSKKALMIDCGDGSDLFLDEISAQEHEIEAILFTHTHYDHVLGLPSFLPAIGYMPQIYVHESEKKYLTDGVVNPEGWMVKGPFPQLSNDQIRCVTHGDVFSLAGMTIEVIHTPGHSPGCVCYTIDKKLLFTGDTLFAHGVGRTDLPGSDPQAMELSISRIQRLDDSLTCYPGHNDFEFTLHDRFL